MAKKEECAFCTKFRQGAYGPKCSYYGKQPVFDGTACAHCDNSMQPSSENPMGKSLPQNHLDDVSAQIKPLGGNALRSSYDDTNVPHKEDNKNNDVQENSNTSTVETERRCPYCGEIIADVAIKCKHCGEWLTEDDDNDEIVDSDEVITTSKNKGYLLGAVIGGVAAGALCTWLWTLIVGLTNYEHSYYAIAVGAIVGFAVRWVGRGETVMFGIVAAVCAVVSCFLGEYLSFVETDFLSVVFYGVAAVEAFSIARNKKGVLSDDDD